MKKIELNNGKFALVDDEDYAYLSRFNWSLSCGRYVVLQIYQHNGKSVSLSMPEFLIKKEFFWQDFIYKNKNPLDNRKENIMLGDHSSRLSYSRKRTAKTSSQFKGVAWSKQKQRWRARINFHQKEIHIGFFINEIEAAEAYNKKAREIYKEFAYQNKIN